MKSFYNKINKSKFLFTIFIIICFIIFVFLTNGIGLWDGLLDHLHVLFNNIYKYTYYGEDFVGEIFWFLLLIPVIIIFKNKYIFTQKRMKLIPSLLLAWPVILHTIIALARSIIQVNISNINVYEVIALLLYTLTVGLFEEIMCRGWLQNEFIERFGKDRKGVIYSIVVSGSIFGFMHITNLFFGQDVFTTLIQIMAAIVTGVSFGAIYYRTKNIWSVIILHGLWDFAVFFAQINATTSCVEISSTIDTITPVLGVLAVFSSAFTSIPEICTALLLMGKKDINQGLKEEDRIVLSEKELKSDKTMKIVLSIIIGIFLAGYFAFILFRGRTSSDTCPPYIHKDVSNYSEQVFNYDNYDLEIKKDKIINECTQNVLNENEKVCEDKTITTKFNYNFKIDDDYNFIITNINNNESHTLKFKNVFSFAIYETNDNYELLLLSEEDNGNVISYRSSYISKDTITNETTFFNELENSFKQVMLPATIIKVGYYQEKNNDYKYPLFISSTEDHYIIGLDGAINKY